MSACVIGYARTSTLDQTYGLATQLEELRKAGCEKVFEEQVSSVDKERPALLKALDYAREGDTLVVTKLDRLARSMTDLMSIKGKLETKGVSLKVLNLNLDTTTPTGKLMLNLLGSVAEFEREIMLERQREGIAKAKAEGKYKGRAPTARRHAEKAASLKAKGVPLAQIMQELKISRSSLFRILKK